MIEAVAALAVEGDARRQYVTDGEVDRALQTQVGVVTDLSLHVTAHIAADDRIVRVHQDRAAGGVLAAEGALRATQDFDTGNVVVGFSLEISWKGCDAVAVGDYTHRRLRVVFAFTDAANVEVIALAKVVDHRARCRELQRIYHGDAKVGEIPAADDRRGDGRCLKIGVPAFCSDY